jgi:predicted transcriptional regulator
MQVSKKHDNVVLNVEVLKDADSPRPLIFSTHPIEFETTDGDKASSLVLRSSDVPASVVAQEDFFAQYPSLKRQSRRDMLERRLPDILEAMYDGAKDWKKIAQAYNSQSKSTFDGYVKRLRTEGLVQSDRYELTEKGREAASILAPSVGLGELLGNEGPLFFNPKVKPDFKPDTEAPPVRLRKPDPKPDSTRTSS